MKSIQVFLMSSLMLIGNVDRVISGNRCIHKADIGFVVDSSGSEQAYYDDVREWLKKMSTAFHIDGRGNNAGIVLFSDDAEVKVTFDDHDSVAEFHQAVDNLPFIGGGTRIDKALDVAYFDLFQTHNGMRDHVHKTLVLLTDGANGGGPPLSTVIQKFHDDQIRVIVVGVGNVNEQELKSMVKEEDDHLFLANDWQHLLSDDFVESTIEGCNLHVDCPAARTELIGGKITQISNVQTSDECRNHCRSTQGCHYWTWYNAKADQNRRRKQPFECELKSDDHCGAWGSYCYRRHHDHAISGTGDPNSCA